MKALNKFWIIIPILFLAIQASEEDSLAKTELMLNISKIQDEFHHVRGNATFSFNLDEKGHTSNVKILKADILPPYKIHEILSYIENIKFSFLTSQDTATTIRIDFTDSKNLKSNEKIIKPIIISFLCACATVFTIIFINTIGK